MYNLKMVIIKRRNM